MTPLNMALYNALLDITKRNNSPPPRVVNPGVKFTYSVVRHRGRLVLRPKSGEEYQLNCPFCGDSRQRLYVKYVYGMPYPDPRMSGIMIDMAFCQREQRKKPQLYSALRDYEWALEHGLVSLDSLSENCVVEDVDPLEQTPPTMGETAPLKSLPYSAHYAYWKRKKYNPEYLSDVYGACVPVSHEDKEMWKMIESRTIFPYKYKGKTVMWQGRLNFDHADKFPPKWWYPGGTKKVLWNIDLALSFPVCILCEGISSAIAAGPAAMAIGGKTLNSKFIEFIKDNWSRVMVMLDPDAGINRKEKDSDYQKRLIDQLSEVGVSVVGAKWSPGDNRDPGDLGCAGCADLICRSSPGFASELSYLDAQ